MNIYKDFKKDHKAALAFCKENKCSLFSYLTKTYKRQYVASNCGFTGGEGSQIHYSHVLTQSKMYKITD